MYRKIDLAWTLGLTSSKSSVYSRPKACTIYARVVCLQSVNSVLNILTLSESDIDRDLEG